MIADAIAATRTAPADKSFIFLIVSFFSIEIKSAVFSIAELINSRANTKPVQKMTAIHSPLDSLNATPAIKTQHVIKRWMRALCSSFIAVFSPLNAY